MAKTSEKSRPGTGTGSGDGQQPFMPGDAAKRRGEVPTGEERNKDYGKGRQSGAVADRGKSREQLQEEELEMNERNH
jgi:hypothetical protein